MIVKNILKAIPIVAIFLITITINPAIVGHAEKGFIQDIATIQKYTNTPLSFNIITTIFWILWLIFWGYVGWVMRGWFDKWQETHQGNETLPC